MRNKMDLLLLAGVLLLGMVITNSQGGIARARAAGSDV